MTTPRAAPCPNCRKPVPLSEPAKHRPFCSERCKLIDLSRWLDGDYVVPGVSAQASDLLAGDGPFEPQPSADDDWDEPSR